MIQATMGKVTQKGEKPQKGRPYPLQEKAMGRDDPEAHQQTEGRRAKNRRVSKAPRSGAQQRKANKLASTNMIHATAWEETGDEMASKPQ